MAYDGIVTMAVAHELSDSITMGKIDNCLLYTSRCV